MGEKAVWDSFHLKVFCEICVEEVNAGHRTLGFLNRTGWKNLEDKFYAKTKKKLVKSQFKNKWDGLKTSYTSFMELKHAATGLGWNDAGGTVLCSEEWWAEHLEACKNCKHVQFRKRGPPFQEEMKVMFDKAHVTGVSVSIPGDISDDSSGDGDAAVDHSDDDLVETVGALKKTKERKRKAAVIDEKVHKAERSPFYREYKGTMSNVKLGVGNIVASVQAGVASMQASSTHTSSYNSVPSIADYIKMIKECGVQEKTALYFTATQIGMKPEVREVFTLIETNDAKLDWLERAHEAEMRKH